MKKIIILLLAFSLFLTACEVEDTPKDNEVPAKDVECEVDSDCIIGGCSGTVCQSKNAEPILTTCEWKEEYACYKQIDCGCVDGKCGWKKTKEFEDCVEKAKK